MGLIDRLFKRADPTLTMAGWLEMLQYGGNSYGGTPTQTIPGQTPREISQSFQGYVQDIYKSNGVVFACMAVRQRLFSEARFQFRQMRNGRPGDLFGTPALGILEVPWTNGTTGDLLARAIMDVDLEGNFYAYREGDHLCRMRPDWVSIALSGTTERDVEVIGYGYHPGGYNSGTPPVAMLPEDVLHWAPYPDPQAKFRGMSWLTPILTEVQADGAATAHKLQFFQNGATPNMIVKFDNAVPKPAFDAFVKAFKEGHEGTANAYKTAFLGGGADATVVGANMQQMTFRETQGAGETRIAAAAGVPPIMVGLSEGLQAATYSNYSQATRSLGDVTMRPLWRTFCSAAANIVAEPSGSLLWYDDRNIPFLQNDEADAASIQQTRAGTMSTLLAAGYEAQSVEAAVSNDDLGLLNHTGLFSVQLQPVPTPEIYMAGVMAGIQSQDSVTAKTLIDAGFEPDSVMQAIISQDMTKLAHTGALAVQLGPIATVGEGKGSLVSGTPVPATHGKNAVRALLTQYLPKADEGVEHG